MCIIYCQRKKVKRNNSSNIIYDYTFLNKRNVKLPEAVSYSNVTMTLKENRTAMIYYILFIKFN